MSCYEIYSLDEALGQPVVSARMCLPKRDLSGLVFAMIERDTRGLQLDRSQRFNHFPVSPLCSVTWVLEGQSHLITNPKIAPQNNAILPPLSFMGPYNKPFASWSPGPVHSISIGFYPESWAELTGRQAGPFMNRVVPLDNVLEGKLFSEMANLGECLTGQAMLEQLSQSVGPQWHDQRSDIAHALSDWIKSLAVRAAMTGTGQSLRQIQRRIRSWTGSSRRTLEKTARMENLHREILIRQDSGDLSLAALAQDLGYSDQSHMGREFLNMTGMSPQKIGHLIETDESYWCYRLLGERLL